MDVALPGQLSLCLSLSFLGDNPKKLTCPRRLEFPPALRRPEEKNENMVSAGEVVEERSVSGQSDVSELVTFRFEHVQEENGFFVLTGREGSLTSCEDEVGQSRPAVSGFMLISVFSFFSQSTPRVQFKDLESLLPLKRTTRLEIWLYDKYRR